MVALPESVPDRDSGTTPLPATGPYMFGHFVPKKELELVRNPNFREWSPHAQPAGFPDRIVVTALEDSEDPVSAIEGGRADVFGIGLLPADQPTDEPLKKMRTRFPGQVHDYLLLGTFLMTLNTESAPFDDVRVRQAINYAVDRRKVASLYYTEARGTCQVIRPTLWGTNRTARTR